MIYTDTKKQIYTDLLYSDLTYKVRGAIFTVYNELGFGHKEQVYQRALEREFGELKIPYKKEVSLKVSYKGEAVGNYRPDFVIEDKIVIEIKALEFMPKTFEAQLIHYLKTTGFSLGLLINFGSERLFIKRLIWTHQRKSLLNL
jgi:GxxExxY protein